LPPSRITSRAMRASTTTLCLRTRTLTFTAPTGLTTLYPTTGSFLRPACPNAFYPFSHPFMSHTIGAAPSTRCVSHTGGGGTATSSSLTPTRPPTSILTSCTMLLLQLWRCNLSRLHPSASFNYLEQRFEFSRSAPEQPLLSRLPTSSSPLHLPPLHPPHLHPLLQEHHLTPTAQHRVRSLHHSGPLTLALHLPQL
jgi:hypothetical protein